MGNDTKQDDQLEELKILEEERQIQEDSVYDLHEDGECDA